MVMQPGQVVLVNQLKSMTPGFVAQLNGQQMTQRYHYATIFVDQFSKLSFVFSQKWLMSAETLLAKQAFECLARDLGVKILHYHANNCRFADNSFIKACRRQHPRIVLLWHQCTFPKWCGRKVDKRPTRTVKNNTFVHC